MPDWFMELFPDSQVGPNEWRVPASRWDRDLFRALAGCVVKNYWTDWLVAESHTDDLSVVIVTTGTTDPVPFATRLNL